MVGGLVDGFFCQTSHAKTPPARPVLLLPRLNEKWLRKGTRMILCSAKKKSFARFNRRDNCLSLATLDRKEIAHLKNAIYKT